MTCPEGTGTGATSSMGGKDSADPCPPRTGQPGGGVQVFHMKGHFGMM